MAQIMKNNAKREISRITVMKNGIEREVSRVTAMINGIEKELLNFAEALFTWKKYKVLWNYEIGEEVGDEIFGKKPKDTFYEDIEIGANGEIIGKHIVNHSNLDDLYGTFKEDSDGSNDWVYVESSLASGNYNGSLIYYDVLVNGEKGNYIEDVTSADENAYPENGIQDGYYYIKQ